MKFINNCGASYVAMLSLAFSLVSAVHAQTVVTTTDDEDDGGLGTGAGTSLREAVLYSAADSTITFNKALSGQTILLTLGQITVSNNLTVDGSALAAGITIDGDANGRIFNFTGSITCVLDSLTLTNGLVESPDFGGAIYSTADLTIRNSTLSGNSATTSGGAIVNIGGNLTIENSTLSGNTASSLGGAIASAGGGDVTIESSTFSGNSSSTLGGAIYIAGNLTSGNSTFTGNSSGYGGGIYSDTDLISLQTTIINSTFFNNSATSYGGAICNFDGRTELLHSTFTGNTAPAGTGSGVASYGDIGTETIVDHCIISGNTNSDVNYILGASNSFTSSGYNLVGTGNALGDFNATGDTTGVTDPELAALGNYGGPTQTMKPMPGSPAIDAGDTTSAYSTDQRGFTRVFNGSADKGAVEVQAPLSRLVFYNNSSWDTDAGASANDDKAIATDKSALLPGGVATFDNYTSYSRGLNGVMVDIAGLLGTPTAADFTFKTGNNNTPSGWGAAPAPSSITVRDGAGTGGSDRVTLIWANNNLDATVDANEAVAKQWLEVTVLATANTGLVKDDVFYFGNAVGDAGNSASNAIVNISDVLLPFNNQSGGGSVGITVNYDFNRDAFVNISDVLIPFNHQTGAGIPLALIDLSASPEPSLALSMQNSPLTKAGLAALMRRAPGSLTAVRTASNRLFLAAPAGSGTWLLQSTDDLNNPDWRTEETLSNDTPGLEISVYSGSQMRFYRVVPAEVSATLN